MVDFTILAVTADVGWLQRLQPDLQALGGTRFVVTASMDEACDLLDTSGARLILLDWGSDGISCETLDRLLWVNTTISHPARVLVVSETYRADLAVTLFQMGVDEYLSSTEHAGQFPQVLLQLLAREAGGRAGPREKSGGFRTVDHRGGAPGQAGPQGRHRIAGLSGPGPIARSKTDRPCEGTLRAGEPWVRRLKEPPLHSWRRPVAVLEPGTRRGARAPAERGRLRPRGAG